MIKFNNITQEPPYLIFKKKYDQALNLGQKNIEAISISSFSKEKNEVDSRFVNLKIIDHNRFIFFTNYDSPKSLAFESHDQISEEQIYQKIFLKIHTHFIKDSLIILIPLIKFF